MSGLLVRADETEQFKMLRSIGDPPNGYVLAMQQSDHSWTWAVEPMGEPAQHATFAAKVGVGDVGEISGFSRSIPPDERSAVPVDTVELVEALEGDVEAAGLWTTALGNVLMIAQQLLPLGRLGSVATALALADETRLALLERGFLYVVEMEDPE